MKKIFGCRRSTLGLIAITFLTGLGYLKGMDVTMAISSIVIGIAGANSYEKSKKP